MSFIEARSPGEPLVPPLSFVVVSLGSQGSLSDDPAGRLAAERILARGWVVRERSFVPESPEKLRLVLERWISARDADAVFISGGTGIVLDSDGEGAPRRVRASSLDVVRSLMDRELPGFAECLRGCCQSRYGTAAAFISALAGIVRDKFVFVVPGIPAVAQLALEVIIEPQLESLIAEVRRTGTDVG
jgi:molybdenum cofactor biosynthesis protein B